MPIQGASRYTNLFEAAGKSSLSGSGNLPEGEAYKGENIKTKQQAISIVAGHVASLQTKGSDKAKEAPEVSLTEALSFLNDDTKGDLGETDLKQLAHLMSTESAGQDERLKAINILQKTYGNNGKRVGEGQNSDLALQRVLTVLAEEIKGGEGRDAAIEAASIINSDGYNNSFFKALGQAENTSLGVINKFLRTKTKYLEYVSTLPKELVKSLEPGENQRLAAVADTDKEFREYLAEKLLATNFQIKAGDIRVNAKLTLKPLKVTSAEFQAIRSDAQGSYSEKTYTLRDVLFKMAAAKDRKGRAAALAMYADMHGVYEYRFGKAVEAIKDAEHQLGLAAPPTSMPGITPAISPAEYKSANQRKAKEAAEQLEALRIAVKSNAIMKDFKEMFEESLGTYSVMLLSSDLPRSINAITSPELAGTFKKEVDKLRKLGYATTVTNDIELTSASDRLTRTYNSRKEELATSIIKSFFGKEGLTTEDLFQSRVLTTVLNPDIDLAERQANQAHLQSEIVESFISDKIIADVNGNIDLTNEANQKVFERYIDPVLYGTSHAISNPPTSPVTVAQIRTALNDATIVPNIIRHWGGETISYSPWRSGTNAITTGINELDGIRKKVAEYEYNSVLVDPANHTAGTTVITARLKASLEDAIKKGTFQEGTIKADKFGKLFEALRAAGYGGSIKMWSDDLDGYQKNKTRAANAVSQIIDALTTAAQSHSAVSANPLDVLRRITEALDLKEGCVLTNQSSFKENLGSAVKTLYETIASEDPNADDQGGIALLQNIITRDEDQASRAPAEAKLFRQDTKGYFEYEMSVDTGFNAGKDCDAELRTIALGRLIQKIEDSGAHERQQQAAVEFIIKNLKENTTNTFESRTPISILSEAKRILGTTTTTGGTASTVFDDFHALQREEARYGVARAAIADKKSELASGTLYRMLTKSLKPTAGIFAKMKSMFEKIRDIFSGGTTAEAAAKLKASEDQEIAPFKEAYSRATGMDSDNWATKSYLKDSGEQQQEYIDIFMKAIQGVDKRLANASPMIEQSGKKQQANKPQPKPEVKPEAAEEEQLAKTN